MNISSAEVNVDFTGRLMMPDCRTRFLKLLQSRMETNGIAFDLEPGQIASGDAEKDIRLIMKTLASSVNTCLGFRETAVVFLKELCAGSYLMECSGCSDTRGEASIGEFLIRNLKGGCSPAFGSYTRIGCMNGGWVEAGIEPAIGVVAPIFVGESIIGMIAAANQSGRALAPEQEARLLSATALLGASAQELTAVEEKDDRVRSLAHALSGALDARNPRARGHSHRVAMYAMAIVNEMGHDEADTTYQDLRNRIRMAALLHDIGKIGIPDSALQEEGGVDEEGGRLSRQHPVLGAEMLRHCRGLRELVPGILYHHERSDGSGYPFGLANEKVPLSAKVVALADAFDVMTSDHGGGEMYSHEEAVGRLTGEMSRGFDPGVLEAFSRAHTNGMLRHVHLPRPVQMRDRPIDAAVEVIYGRQLTSIPVLPDALYKVNSLLDSPEASLKEIAHLLSTDSGLASRVLKLVNSAYYGLSRTVATIPLATTILGIRAIKSQVVNIAYADVMNELGGRYEEYRILWRHALKAAAWARAVASEISDNDIEEAFTAGLVHDVGRALCLRLKPETYGRLVTQSQMSGRPLIAVEEEVMGFNHMRMGGWMASKWMLPESLINSIRWHHDPECVIDQGREAYELIRIIHIADVAAKASESIDVDFVPFVLRELSPVVLRELGSAYVVDLEQFKEAVEEAEIQLEETFAEAAVGVS